MFERGGIGDRRRFSNGIDRPHQRTCQMQDMAIDQMTFLQEEETENLQRKSSSIIHKTFGVHALLDKLVFGAIHCAFVCLI